jgi:hypothetical protein
MKRVILFITIAALCFNLVGCETVAKKFRRKKKEPVKRPRIYQVKKYPKKPVAELYKKRYAYWESWQSELIETLGKNQKKDVRCVNEIISNLTDMKGMLVPERAEAMEPHIERMRQIRQMVSDENMGIGSRDYLLMTLEREDRAISREFRYGKVKDCLMKDMDDEGPSG